MSTRRGGKQFIPRPSSVRAGGPPPWAGLPSGALRLTLADVRARLALLPAAVEAVERVNGSRAAAVLVPMFETGGEAYVVLIKRPETMPSHRGEIAFPGGGFEPGVDADLEAAALREAHEEVGLAPADVEIVARLDGISTVASRFTITPFVGFLAERPHLAPNPREVVRVLEVPLSELLAEGVYREERWDMWMRDSAIHFYELEDETVWGATARILTGLLAHLVSGS
jgi:8-oxo-dGTP pyrophosphatase MutT (NUDIX family)